MGLSHPATIVRSSDAKNYLQAFEPLVLKCQPRNDRIKPINTVSQIIKSLPNLPETAVLLGICHDGVPILLDLVESTIGSVLVMCDEGCGKTHQLQVIVESSVLLNDGGGIQVGILSKNPWEWENSIESYPDSFILGCHNWHSDRTAELITFIIDICEERLKDSRAHNNILFVLDDLDEINKLDNESKLALEWLFDYGPEANIWPIASLCSDSTDTQQYFGNCFRTQIIGRLGLKQSCSRSNQYFTGSSDFDPGEFAVSINDKWMTYRLPMLG